ncbi:hypothetical protein ACP70R_023590 [Stipagrostis hirtigluma subsp. patula]
MDLEPANYVVQQRARTLSVLAVLLSIIRWRRRMRNRNRCPPRKYAPLVARDLVRKTRLDELYNGTDTNCINQLRMRKAVFFKLSARLRDAGLLRDTIHVSVEEQLAMFLHTVGHNLRNRVIGLFVKRSSETVSRYFNQVLKALCFLAKDMIKLRSVETHAKITSSPGRFYPYFKDCIGALDGTHIPAFVPENIVNRFRGRKSYATQNVLAAVDFDLRFTYVLAGWEGSAHDSVVLKAALKRSNGIPMPEGKYYLADAGYAARPGILPPYRGVRYHLKEYEGGREPQTPQELFNLRHSSLRTTVERAFGTLKNRFKILASKPFFPFKVQVKIVIACCVLHNWILDNGPDNIVYDEARWYSSLPRSSRIASDQGEDNRQWVAKRDHLADLIRHKDTWALVARHMNESGGGWDDDKKMLLLSESTLANLSVNDRGILSKPIQFFDKLQELFSGCSADGTFMQDPSTAGDDSDLDTNALDNMDDMFAYGDSKDPELLDDSDKLSSDSDDCKEVAAMSASASQVSSSSAAALKPNKKSFKKIGKQKTLPPSHNGKASKSRSKAAPASQDDDDQDVLITSTLIGIKQSLEKPIQVAAPPDPNAPLWEMLKNIPTLTADDRMTVGLHLCKPEFQVHRNFLVSMGMEYLERWVYKHLSGDDPGA